jgi:hypothetical protein
VDAYFNGRLDSIKLNSRALSLAEITAPTAVINAPAAGARYAGGDVISFAGGGSDYAEAPLMPGALSWAGEFHHEGAIDSVFGPLSGVTNGMFVIATNGPTTTNAFYRIKLVVTDTNGSQQAASTDLRPRLSTLEFATVPAGLEVTLDGESLATPASVVAVVGLNRELGAPSPQNLGGSNYDFVVWSDGGRAAHNITVPAGNWSYTASFVQPLIGVGSDGMHLNLQWPAWAAALQLYCATNLTPPATWSLVTNMPAPTNGMQTLALPMQEGDRFYRLQQPP